MIEYSPGKWGVAFVFSCSGSVFPKAAAWAVPSSFAVVGLHFVLENSQDEKIGQLWSTYNFVLGFLLVFRTQSAYSRFMEGATILNQVRATWLDFVSGCVSFCNEDPESQEAVEKFQHMLIRLVSLLFCSSLQSISTSSDEAYNIIDPEGLNKECMHFLACIPEKNLVLVQWIQRLLVMNHEQGVLKIPPPILSRAFQQLSQGIVDIISAQKITDILFPFPYAQMVSFLLMMTTLVTPVIFAVMLKSPFWKCSLTFITVFCFWCINYIAAEIEMPFGEDSNDLPISTMQDQMNRGLALLVAKGSRVPPSMVFREEHKTCSVTKCPPELMAEVQCKISEYEFIHLKYLHLDPAEAGFFAVHPHGESCPPGFGDATAPASSLAASPPPSQRGPPAADLMTTLSPIKPMPTLSADNMDEVRRQGGGKAGVAVMGEQAGSSTQVAASACSVQDIETTFLDYPPPEAGAVSTAATAAKVEATAAMMRATLPCLLEVPPMVTASGEVTPMLRHTSPMNDVALDLELVNMCASLKDHFDQIIGNLDHILCRRNTESLLVNQKVDRTVEKRSTEKQIDWITERMKAHFSCLAWELETMSSVLGSRLEERAAPSTTSTCKKLQLFSEVLPQRGVGLNEGPPQAVVL
eukprot:TRINITY_DN67347_c0_g1_i1.p1 TRINITY_DN67347_c0_g1~~TRINITY_DN67347_c0_g1_i1.p1  ORF type:complete len:637 (+),score=113.35 TRINITY_DN67347_c0_g1_i1:241-2151(+)